MAAPLSSIPDPDDRGPGHWEDLVLEGGAYKKISTDALLRVAAGGDQEAIKQVERRAAPPAGAPDPDDPSSYGTDDAGEWFTDSVVDDEPYWSMPKGLLRNLAADDDAGAVDELIRRGLPIVGP